jgi:hypothetical protein
VIRYDDATGAVTLDYTNGRDLERDVDRSKVPGNHLRFWDPYWTKPGNSSPGEEEFAFSFDANTSGFFFTPVPFRYRVRVEWEAQIQTMDQDASLACLVMLDRGKESYYMADFVHLSLVEAGSRKWLKPLGGPFAASPNSWFEKKRQVAMRVEYQMPDPAQAPKGPLRSGRLSVSYDLGGELEAANKAPAKARERGFVAFRWHRAKFQARRLRISGILDKERAVSLLRQKLNGAKAPRRQNAPERPRGETAPDPTGALVGHALGPRQADDQASPLDETWTRGLIHAP